jgi:hypothetical protein
VLRIELVEQRRFEKIQISPPQIRFRRARSHTRLCHWLHNLMVRIVVPAAGLLIGFGVFLLGLFGNSTGTRALWLVPALGLAVALLFGLLPTFRDPASRVIPFVAYTSALALGYFYSSGSTTDSLAQAAQRYSIAILWTSFAIGACAYLADWRPLVKRRLILCLFLGWLVSYFSSSAGGTGGGSWERWLADHLGISLHAAELLVIGIRKSIHLLFYGVLALLAAWTARGDKLNIRVAAVFGFCFALAHASFDEIRQSRMPDRTGQLSDVLIDMAGAALFLWLYLGLRKTKLPSVSTRPV